jgi:lipopolysaccharide exporter
MGAIVALQFLTLALLARLLSPSDFGLMGMITVVIGFAQAFADMGISNAIIYRQDATKDQLSSLYWINILAGFVVFCCVCASNSIIVHFYHEPRISKLLYLTSIIFLITPLGQQFQILLQKELRFNELAKIEITASTANSLIAIFSAFSGFGVFSLVYGQLAGTSAKVFMLFIKGWRKWRPSLHFSGAGLKMYVNFGLYQIGERLVNYFNSNLDYLLIGSMLGAKGLGYYTLAHNLVLRPSQLINPVITKVAFPVFSRIQNDTDRLKRGYLKILQLLSIINFPIMAGIAVLAPIMVPIIFGEQWLPSIILIQILSIVGLLRSTSNPVGSLLLAKGRADLGFKWNLILTLTQVPGLYIGARLGGAIGVAIAYAILMGIYTLFNYLVLVRTLLGPCGSKYFQSMWPSLWMSSVMLMLMLYAGLFFKNNSRLLVLIIQVLSGLAVYCCLLFFSQKKLLIDIK